MTTNNQQGIKFAQLVHAKLLAGLEQKHGDHINADIAAERLGYDHATRAYISKAIEHSKALLGTTTDPKFASTLAQAQLYRGEFVELLREHSLLSQIQGMRRVPFKTKINGQLSGGIAHWVGEGAAKPLTNPTFGQVEIKEHKLAAITVYTQELVRQSNFEVERYLRDDLIEAITSAVDKTFLDNEPESEKRPAGILHNAPKYTAKGYDLDNVQSDLLNLVNQFQAANTTLDGAMFVMPHTIALKFLTLRTALGVPAEFLAGLSGLQPMGGINPPASIPRTLLGIPVALHPAANDKIVLINPRRILLGDDDRIDVAFSEQATLTDGSVTHNLWQENKFAVRAEKFITWAKVDNNAVHYLDYSGV